MSQSDKPDGTPTEGLPQRKDITKLLPWEQDNLIDAFKNIQELDPDDPDSFFKIASYHGAPFRGAGYANQNWWGGYCNHGNILFPTWHRAYVLCLEQSLERHGLKIKLPYWNELEEMTEGKSSLPEIFLKPKWQSLNGKLVDNPLYSYKYQQNIVDHASPRDGVQYTKPKGCTTVRYPFSGLYGPRDIDDSQYHNKYYQNLKDKFYEEQENKKKHHKEPLGDREEPCNKLLNANIKMWLEDENYPPDIAPPHSRTAHLKKSYCDCLKVKDYTVFSNTTSAQAWNDQYYHDQEGNKDKVLVSLETPHDGMHLALGGVEVPSQLMSYVRNANGDMGENNTAAFDPIFYFHHCFIDLIFWKWQLKYDSTTELKIDKKFEDYPGTSSVDGQGPTPGMTGADFLSMDTPLRPFHIANDPDQNKPLQLSTKRQDPFLKSTDVVDISKLGYDYIMPKELSDDPVGAPGGPPGSSYYARVSDVSRADIRGSFVIAVWAQKDAEKGKDKPCREMVACYPVLNRWNVADCANCQSHLDVKALLPLHDIDSLDNTTVTARVHTRDNHLGTEITAHVVRME